MLSTIKSFIFYWIGLFSSNNKTKKKYYIKSVKCGNYHAMNNLGVYYARKNKSELSKKYYKMAIVVGNRVIAMGNLSIDYYEKKNIKK